jgi:hypothetical protein
MSVMTPLSSESNFLRVLIIFDETHAFYHGPVGVLGSVVPVVPPGPCRFILTPISVTLCFGMSPCICHYYFHALISVCDSGSHKPRSYPKSIRKAAAAASNPFECDLCGILLNSRAMYNSHVEGIREGGRDTFEHTQSTCTEAKLYYTCRSYSHSKSLGGLFAFPFTPVRFRIRNPVRFQVRFAFEPDRDSIHQPAPIASFHEKSIIN